MFNNSEPYGRNELPNTMITQVNVPQLPRSNNNAINFNISGKQGCETPQRGSEQFNMQSYSDFASAAMNFEPTSDPFANTESDPYDDRLTKTIQAGLDFVAVDVPQFKMDIDQDIIPTIEQNKPVQNPPIQVPSIQPSADLNIEVKLEPGSWADTDYQQPFCRDVNGIQHYDTVGGKIVCAETSVDEALECIRNGSSSIVYYECPACSTLLRHPKRFLIHVKWHAFGLTNARRLQEQQEIKEIKDVKRKARLEERIKKEEEREAIDGDFPCKDCDKIFIARSGLKKHRAKYHPVQMTECKVCLAPVNGLSGFRAHMATHTAREAGTETHKYKCPECPKKYKFSHSLYKHIDTHLEKKHKCEVCTKMFGSEAQLGRHMKSHEKIARGAQFHCAYCGKGYYDTFTLQIHERIHTNERPFSCEICQAAFQTNSSLKRHTRISHNSDAPHRCATCQRAFNSEKVLDRHILRAHSDPDNFQYPCSMCDRRYFKPKDLRNHMYKVHPKRASSKSETE